jgi:hypothetical protein
MTIQTVITAAELIEILKGVDPNAVVLIECDDPAYGGPISRDRIRCGDAVLVGPHDGPRCAESGQEMELAGTMSYPGGWEVEGDYYGSLPIVERRPCVIVQIGD